MDNGLYAVHFRAAGDEGTGVVTITDGSVNGGDRSHYYQGKLEQNGQETRATLAVSQYNPAFDSIFGSAGNFEVEVSGPSNEKGFELTGNIKGNPGQKVDISGHYLKPLV